MTFFRLPDGSLIEITKVYPLDAVFDNPVDVVEDVIKSFTYSFWNNLHNVKLYSF